MIEKCILKQNPRKEIEPENVRDEADYTILVRKRVRGTKLEEALTKVRRKVVNQSDLTIAVMPKSSKSPTVYSKRDVTASRKLPSCQILPSSNKAPKQQKATREEMAQEPKKSQRKRGLER